MKPNAIDEFFMLKALRLARQAAAAGEVPVGAILVREGKIVSQAFNRTRSYRDPTAHAEIVALQKAVSKIKNERFLHTTLYVTKEPCVMCAGAIVQARIPFVVFGISDPKAGACGSSFRILPSKKLNHRPHVTRGVLADEALSLLKDFFKKRR